MEGRDGRTQTPSRRAQALGSACNLHGRLPVQIKAEVKTRSLGDAAARLRGNAADGSVEDAGDGGRGEEKRDLRTSMHSRLQPHSSRGGAARGHRRRRRSRAPRFRLV